MTFIFTQLIWYITSVKIYLALPSLSLSLSSNHVLAIFSSYQWHMVQRGTSLKLIWKILNILHIGWHRSFESCNTKCRPVAASDVYPCLRFSSFVTHSLQLMAKWEKRLSIAIRKKISLFSNHIFQRGSFRWITFFFGRSNPFFELRRTWDIHNSNNDITDM